MVRTVVTLLVLALGGGAQASDFIVRFATAQKAKQFLNAGFYPPEDQEVLVPEMNLYLIKEPQATGNVRFLEVSLRSSPHVLYLGKDRPLKLRQANDPLRSKQWYLQSSRHGGIHADGAWKISTGGPNQLGQAVVAAIVDAGVDINHEDLRENIWLNKSEIPGNGIDDDGDGYIDDVHGWNAYDNTGEVEVDDHGTHVAGVIAARGNNHIGISGMNWNGQIMPISGAETRVSVVAKAYGYILRQKKLWLESGGALGANVVVVNSSFGEDGQNCMTPEHHVWNDLFNELGKVGVLSVAATTNDPIDVDTEGDIPSTCDSPFLVMVTSVDRDDKLFALAGWGKKSVDLGAPGYSVLSSIADNQYEEATGTSVAAPQVTGAILLMQSAASADFIKGYQKSPAEFSLKLRDMLFSAVDPSPSLKQMTTTGGRLNVERAVKLINSFKME